MLSAEEPQVSYTDSSLLSRRQGPSFHLRSWRPQTDSVRPPSNSPLPHPDLRAGPRAGASSALHRLRPGGSVRHRRVTHPPRGVPATRRRAPDLTLKRTGMSPGAAEPAPPTVNGTKSPEGAGRQHWFPSKIPAPASPTTRRRTSRRPPAPPLGLAPPILRPEDQWQPLPSLRLDQPALVRAQSRSLMAGGELTNEDTGPAVGGAGGSFV